LSRGAYATHPPGLHEALVVPKPDIVCVGSRGQKLLKRLVLGSVSTATLASSNVPVCVYRADLPAPSPESVQTRFKLGDEQQSSRAVCIALSGSDASHTVVGWSLATLLRPSDRVVLLHCDASRKARRRGLSEEHVTANLRACEETVRDWMARRGAKTRDEQGSGQAAQSVISLRLEESPSLAEDVRDRLVDFLEKTDVQLLVLGRSNRAGGFNAWSLGTVPMYAVTHGPCPVLVVNARGAYESPAA
jgi:nucleotide-binding universal stress UspA family protein